MSTTSQPFPSSFELWEFVSAFEDGSLPAAACTEDALAAIAVWYLSMSLGDGGDAFTDVWPCLLRRLLSALGANDPVALANRLLPGRTVEARDRAA